MNTDNDNTSFDSNENAFDLIKQNRLKNKNKVILAHLNINSIRNKFTCLKELVSDNIDVLVIQETKLDETFPERAFMIPGYKKPFRKDRNSHGGGIMVFIRDDIPSREVPQIQGFSDLEGMFVEINLRKSKWLLFATYKPPSFSKDNYFSLVNKALDAYGSKFENIILMGDLNTTNDDENLVEFLEDRELSNLVHFPTCFMSETNPSTIDLIITNKPKSFQNTIGVSTGISDFHKMVLTSMKTTFPKAVPKEIVYRDMKNFDKKAFKRDLKENLKKADSTNYALFEEIFENVLDKHAPKKKKIQRANHKPYVTKAMRKAIMKRSELATKYRTRPTEENKKAFKKQRNFCNRLYKKERQKYYENLDLRKINDNKKFWNTVKPLMSNKGPNSQKISLKEGDKLVTDDIEIANVLNKHFVSSVRCLAEKGGCSAHVLDINDEKDTLDNIFKRFKLHPSIIAIKEKSFKEIFDFTLLTTDEVLSEINKLDHTKSTTGISISLLKDNSDICAPILTNIFNSCINNGVFPDQLKLADITPIFKSVDSMAKKNYRPVSILNSVSKLFEKLIQKQLNPFFDDKLSEYLCGYRKGNSTQYALLNLIESWKKYRDNHGYSAAVLMDLSKAFDTINHDLLLAKLHAYGVSKNALKLMMSYLRNRYQRTKVNGEYSSWEELLTGVPQGSVLGPLLFNIYLNDLLYAVENAEICNFADDTTPHSSGYDLKEVMIDVEHDCSLLVEWFRDNYLTLNADKCHLLVSGYKCEAMYASVGDALLWEENSVKLLGLIIDSELTFNNYVQMICKKASQKLTAIVRLANIISEKKRKVLLKTFFESQFSYCPLLWMFCSRKLNNKINRLHERALRIAYADYVSSFEELLAKDDSVTIHQRNLKVLAVEMYKISQGISPKFMNDLVEEFDTKYHTRSRYGVELDEGGNVKCLNKKLYYRPQKSNTSSFGLESFRWLGPKIWELIPDDLKNTKNLATFKSALKKLNIDNCPCKLCKNYIQGVGYIS